MLRSHAGTGNEFQTPWHHLLPAKQWDAWFLNSSKSKTRLKFMKLGMLSWSSINMPWWKFCPIWAGSGISFSQTRASHNKHDGFGRERPTFGTKRYPLPLIASKFFCVNIEQQECCVIFCDFSGFIWTFLCIKWVFNAFMCIIQIRTTCTCCSAYKLIEKSNICPWVPA